MIPMIELLVLNMKLPVLKADCSTDIQELDDQKPYTYNCNGKATQFYPMILKRFGFEHDLRLHEQLANGQLFPASPGRHS
jgi:hypothetical protein